MKNLLQRIKDTCFFYQNLMIVKLKESAMRSIDKGVLKKKFLYQIKIRYGFNEAVLYITDKKIEGWKSKLLKSWEISNYFTMRDDVLYNYSMLDSGEVSLVKY